MNVKEIIEELEKYDGDIPVIATDFGGFHRVEEVKGDNKVVKIVFEKESIF